MYDQEIDTSAPYDNVEFPVRKPGTGTWPGPGGTTGGTGSAGVKLYGHQTTGRAPKLAPLVEVEGSEGTENNRLQTVNFGTTSSSLSSSSSSSTTAASQQQQSKFSTQSSTSQNKAMTSQNSSSIASTTTQTSSVLPSSGTALTTTASTSATTTTTTTASTTNSSGKQASTEKNNRPVIMVTNDSNTYIAAQVNEPPRKKTLKQVETEEEDFKRQDLNPGARLALERVYTHHPDFYQLNTKVLDEGSLLKQDVLDIYRKTGESLTYEQLLQGILVDGERFLLGSCWLYYTHVQFLDVEGTRALREPYGRGRIGLTSKRALFLSTETYTDANLEQFDQSRPDDKKKKPDDKGYKLEVSKRSTVTFKNIPLSNFHSAEMEVVTGTAAQTKITKKPGCCTCFGLMAGKWMSTPPMTRSINSRVLRVGVSMPPWQTRMFLDIHLDPSMSLTVARDFISQLHAFAPHMH